MTDQLPTAPPPARPGLVLRALGYVPYGLCCMAIYMVSDLADPDIPEALTFRFSDKLLHAAAYSVVGACAAFGARFRQGEVTRAIVIEGALLGALYGVFDEVHQSLVPGRSATVSDVLADGIGSLLGAVLAYRAFCAYRSMRTKREAASS